MGGGGHVGLNAAAGYAAHIGFEANRARDNITMPAFTDRTINE
jgi:hypothetical protein